MADIVYNIQFTVDRATPKVTPTAPQKAGYYGDDNAARLTFSGVDDSFDYQIEIVDGNGAYDITETLNTNGAGNLVYEVPSAWTAAGLASVRLVELGEESVMHYPEVQLLFEARDTGEQMGDMLPRWQSVMRDSEAATQDAIEAAEYATQAGEFAASQTPNIQNGEWYLGDQNTGVQATGEKGEKGERGPQGPKGDNGIVDYTKAANALKGKVEGNPIAIKDASPFEQNVSVKAELPNLLPSTTAQEDDGVTLTPTGDGSYVLNGASTDASSELVICSVTLEAGEYMFSLNNDQAVSGVGVTFFNKSYEGFSLSTDETNKSYGVSLTAGTYELAVSANYNVNLQNFKIKPQLVKYTFGVTTVTKYGKNLLDLSQTTNRTRCTYNAETNEFISNIIDSYYCSITTRQLNDILLASKGKSFTFSVGKGNEDKGTILVIYGTRTDGKEYQDVDSGLKPYVTVTVAEEFTAIDRVTLRFNQHATKSTDTTTVLSDLQFELGDTATDYEPYVEPTLIENSITMKGEGVTLFANNGETLTAEYSRDINKAFAELWKKVMEG